MPENNLGAPELAYPGIETPLIDSVVPEKTQSNVSSELTILLVWSEHAGQFPEYQVSGIVTEFLKVGSTDMFPERQSGKTHIVRFDMKRREVELLVGHVFASPGEYYVRVTFGQHHDIAPSEWRVNGSGSLMTLKVE